jgi:ankyrin repeat protein
MSAAMLCQAARSNDIIQAQQLIQSNIDINGIDSTGSTALHHACNYGQLSMVLFLLKAGCRWDIATNTSLGGYAPIHLAIRSKHTDVLQVLLEHSKDSAHVNAISASKTTPIMEAAKIGNLSMIQLLLQASADTSLTDVNGFTAHFYAQKFRHTECVKVLIPQTFKLWPQLAKGERFKEDVAFARKTEAKQEAIRRRKEERLEALKNKKK